MVNGAEGVVVVSRQLHLLHLLHGRHLVLLLPLLVIGYRIEDLTVVLDLIR